MTVKVKQLENKNQHPPVIFTYFICWVENHELKTQKLEVTEHDQINKDAEDFLFTQWLEDGKNAPEYAIIDPLNNLYRREHLKGLAARDTHTLSKPDTAGHFVIIRDSFIAGHLEYETRYFYGLINKAGDYVRVELIDRKDPQNPAAFHEWIAEYKKDRGLI
jgi:hypothetical protein